MEPILATFTTFYCTIFVVSLCIQHYEIGARSKAPDQILDAELFNWSFDAANRKDEI